MQNQRDFVIPDPGTTAGFSSSSYHRVGLLVEVEAGRKKEGVTK